MIRAILAVAAALWAAPVGAQDTDGQGDADAVRRGEALLTKNCASCHAVGRTGASPHAEAPPFRTLSQNYPVEALEEALAEGLQSGHPDMPEFTFDPDQIGDLIAYLKSVQQP